MRTSIDILNYFRRNKQRKESTKLKQELKIVQKEIIYFKMKCTILERELNAHKHIKEMYDDLVGILNNVDKYCALRQPKKIRTFHPLQRFGINNRNLNSMFGYHYENLHCAEILIQDYAVEECIHFELNTGDGRYRYQYSKKGLAIQPITGILKEVTKMMASAWYNKIHN